VRVVDRLLVAGFALASAWGSGLQAQVADANEDRRVGTVSFVGVRSVNRSDLARSLATRSTKCRSLIARPFCLVSNAGAFVEKHDFDPEELPRDELRIRVFYWQRGYRDAQVSTVVDEGGERVDVVFTVTEGPPTLIEQLRVVQSQELLSERDIRNAKIPAEGTPLNLILLDSAILRLRGTLWQRGWSDAEVRDTATVSDSANVAMLEIAVDPRRRTTVGEIRIEGNEKIGERTIRNSLALREGGLYRRGDVLVSQRNLYESNLFRQALIEVPETEDTAKIIEVTVREAPLRSARATVGFNTIDFVQTEGRYTHFNWMGGARRLDVRATLGNLLAPQLNGAGIFKDVTPVGLTQSEEDVFLEPTWNASIDVTQPWFRGYRNALSIGTFAHRRTVPGIVVDRGVGARASFTRRLAVNTSASLTYNFEITHVEAGEVYYCVNFGVCDVGTIEALRSSQTLSPLGLSISSDRASDPITPTGGYRWRINAEHASSATVSDFRYNRIAADGASYFRLGVGVLAARLRIGWVGSIASTSIAVGIPGAAAEDILHPRKRFYAGGSRSVRGYGENQLGPRILTIAPSALTDTTLQGGCSRATLELCDPNGVPSTEFQPRPLGGNALLEGSLEYRFPLSERFGAAVFIDAGSVGEKGFDPFSGGFSAVTPGFGFRYDLPIGAVRVDLGIRPTVAEELPVITQITDANGDARIIRLETPKRYDPLEGRSGIGKILGRLALHLSIGQAF
jgi:outer membrane protein assembly factor BamA